MEKLQATLTTDTFTRMKELVSFEIYNNLPRFDENEEFLFNQIGTDSKTNKDKYIEFYDFLKKKHNENTKFSFLQYDSLHTYYNLQKSYDLYNPMFKKNFDLEIYLHSFYTRDKESYFNEFKAFFNGRMRTLECKDVLTNQQDWSTIEINEAFVNDTTTNERLMILLKYNPLFLGKCLYFSISSYYPNIDRDLYEMLQFHKETTHLIVDFKNFSDEKGPVERNKFNAIIKLFLDAALKYQNLRCFILKNKENQFSLSLENSKLLKSILSLNIVWIFVCSNFPIHNEAEAEFINEVYNNYIVRVMFLEGTSFSIDSLLEFSGKYDTTIDPSEQRKACLIRFDKEHRFENFYAERADDDKSVFGKGSSKGSKILFDAKSRTSSHRGLLFDKKSKYSRPTSKKKKK